MLPNGDTPVTPSGVDVLVVDDDAAIRTTLQMALEDEGYAVAIAADGAQALRAIHQHHPALVLLDLWMPRMDGWQVHAALCATDPQMPVVFMSAEPMVAKHARWLGAASHLAKPFDVGQVYDLVEQYTTACTRFRPMSS